jgi:acetylornithine deacetylase/succinyl-diaminopimelate desuccinylase-like protein
MTSVPAAPSAVDTVAGICSELIRIDTSNYGDSSGPGERSAAEYVAARLSDAGLTPEIVESEPGRASVIARWAGQDSSRPGLLVHGHLDVVPAQASDWSADPFGGEVRGDCLWGRGAVDMKDFDAMVLALVGEWAATGRRPRRDVVLAFLADEEAGGRLGASWLVDNRPDLFEGCSEAISEVGGFSMTLEGRRFYLLETAQKGIAWMRLVAAGTAGHGSMVAQDNAVAELCAAVARIGGHQWPVRMTATVRAFLEAVGEGIGVDLDPERPDEAVARLGHLSRMIGATLRNTANPTMLEAGYKVNVIPQGATAMVDGRPVPGYEREFLATIDELLGPKVRREMVWEDRGLENPPSGPLWDRMVDAVLAEDPGALVAPYCLSGGTDNKSFARLGIAGYGFAPLQLPPDLDFPALFHGVDERVPLEALRFGIRVLGRLLDTA